MRALDLIENYPMVHPADPALEVARMIGSQRLPGVVVVDEQEAPITVLPGAEVLNFIVPSYVQQDPSLTRVYDERAADESARRLEGKTVGDLLPARDRRQELPVVTPEATVLACAAVMARLHSPLVVVRDGTRTVGVATASRLLDELFG